MKSTWPAKWVRFQRFTPVVGIAAVTLLVSGTLAADVPSLQQALDARQDIWGLAAMQQPNGPNYAFFEKLLPPLRYVNAQFRHYPIVLSAPNAPVKARLVSNGSAINARAALSTWSEVGIPITFSVGSSNEVFGTDLHRLAGPKLAQGYLPIVQLEYDCKGTVYQQECFAGVEPVHATNGIVFVRFGVKNGPAGRITANIDSKLPLAIVAGQLKDTNGLTFLCFGDNWNADSENHNLTASVSSTKPAFLAIATKPFSGGDFRLTPSEYESQRAKCISTWEKLLRNGATFSVPEPVANDACRALLVQNYALVNGNEPRYSAGNAYDRLYQAECDDITVAFMLWGFASDTRRMVVKMQDYSRDKLEFHNAAFKLQTLARYYWLTRDKEFIAAMREKWSRQTDRIVNGREPESGLVPREAYCGDIQTSVYSLNSNASAWRGLRDFAAILMDMGDYDLGERLANAAADFREKIWQAANKSIFTNTQPPFVPIALFGDEKPHDPLTATMLGSYWDLMAPYLLGSGVFGPGSQRERWIVDYLQEKGGVCMGMIRFDQHSGLFANENGIDDLYSFRYVETLLRLDEVDRALVSFYGKLAQGLTRDTFVGGEGTGLKPLDEFGRPMYLPPNATGNAYFLFTLRNLLVQDWDLDDDGRPETLRLLFATPKAWLADGKTISFDRMPTPFGEVSVQVKSNLKRGEVIAEVLAPTRSRPERTLLRIRLPDGFKVTSARSGSQQLPVDDRGTIDISQFRGKFEVRFKTTTR